MPSWKEPEVFNTFLENLSQLKPFFKIKYCSHSHLFTLISKDKIFTAKFAFRSEMTKAIGFELWSPDQEHRHHLGT